LTLDDIWLEFLANFNEYWPIFYANLNENWPIFYANFNKYWLFLGANDAMAMVLSQIFSPIFRDFFLITIL
jgi:hypothetical protein